MKLRNQLAFFSPNIFRLIAFGLLNPLLILCLAKHSVAEDLSDEEITEIVVHASPLGSKAKEYAGSASIYKPDDSINPSKLSFEDIIESSPNLSWAGGTSAPRFFQIRGIGELEQYEGAPNPSVGLIFDDLDLSGLGLPTTLFDIEQTEVLRGPQATMFGANGLAGVVALKSTAPTPYDSMRAMLNLGNDNTFGAGLAFGGSVLESKDLSFRLSVADQQNDGFRKDLYLNRDDTNSRENSDVRLQLHYQPSHETKIDVEGIYAEQNNGYDAFAINNAFTTQSDRPGKDDHDLTGSKLSIEHLLSESTKVQSISSFSASDLDYGFDGDWGNNEFWGENAPYDYRSASTRERDVFSQEFRLASTEESKNSWLFGVFGQHLKENSNLEEFQDEIAYDSLDSSYKADTYAAFFAAETPISESTFLGGSFRAEHRETNYNDSNAKDFNPDFNMQGGSAYIKENVTESDQLYASVSRGFKGGGFNAGTRIPDNLLQYQPESLWNYEIGAKGSAISNLLDYNLSTFWMQRYNQQIKLALQDDPNDPLSFSYLTDNVAQGSNLGLEASVLAHLSEALELSLNTGLLDTKISSVDPLLSNLQDREQSSAAPWSFSAAARYLLSERWYIRSSFSGKDSYYFDDSHDQKSDPYYLLDAEIGWFKDHLKISLWGKNLCNENYAVRGFYFGLEPPDYSNKLYIQRGDPTSFGITATYLF